MSKKQKPPYLLQLSNAEEAGLVLEMCMKVAVNAQSAHVMAAIYSRAQAAAKYFQVQPPASE